jgi:hypothetical protein
MAPIRENKIKEEKEEGYVEHKGIGNVGAIHSPHDFH